MSILDTIAAAARKRVERDRQLCPEAKLPVERFAGRTPFLFEKALRTSGTAFICEVKKASPSKGVIAEDFPYVSIAQEYEKAGASAISVLTEPKYFLGRDCYLEEIREAVNLPLLRKDFTIDPYQITQAKALGADAVLLICSLLSEETLAAFLLLAGSLGLSCLVEAHDAREIEMALEAGARIIGVNNRNLKDFTVNTENSIQLRRLVPQDVIFVAESGIQTPEDVLRLRQNGIHSVLVGEALMRAEDKAAALARLRGESE